MIDFGTLLKARSTELSSSLAATRSVLWHPGQKGGVVENRVRDFVRSVLPTSLGVTEGIVYDSQGGVSNQCDIIVYDHGSAPIVFNENGTRAIPVECVYGVIEVKTSLGSREFADSMKAMRRLKSMPKSAFRFAPRTVTKTFRLFDEPLNHFPLFHYLFACEGLAIKKIADELQSSLESGASRHEVINAVTILDSGTAAYFESGWISVPTKTARAACSTDEGHLLLWLGLFLDMMLAAEMYYPLDFMHYLNNQKFNVSRT